MEIAAYIKNKRIQREQLDESVGGVFGLMEAMRRFWLSSGASI